MDDSIKLLITIFGSLVTVFLGLIASGVRSMNLKQTEQSTQIALLSDNINNIVKRIDSLDAWRSEVQDEKIEYYKDKIKRLEDA